MRSVPAGIFVDPKQGLMIRFEDRRERKATDSERSIMLAALVAQGIQERLSEGDGIWRTCSGCHESEDGHDVGREALEALAEQHARNWGANSNGGTVSMLVDFAVTVARAAKPEPERVMSKDELETEMRDLAMTVKVATIEACAKIAEQNYALMFTNRENRETARKVSKQIVLGIRALEGTSA